MFENLQLSYVRLNPQGVVPTLVDGDKVICDSIGIMYYLEQKFPNPKLTPAEFSRNVVQEPFGLSPAVLVKRNGVWDMQAQMLPA